MVTATLYGEEPTGLLSDATLEERVRVENDFPAMRMTLIPTKTRMCVGRLGWEGR